MGRLTKKLRMSQTTRSTKWSTKAGVFETNKTCKVQFILPEFDQNKIIEWTMHVDDSTSNSNYDMIIGTDLMVELGMNIEFDRQVMTWEQATVPLKNRDILSDVDMLNEIHEQIYTSDELNQMSDRQARILDADYHAANLEKVAAESKHLTLDEQVQLFNLLRQYEYLFDGTLGKWKGRPVDIELKDDVKPYHAKPYPIPHSLKTTTRKECDRLCKLGVLRRINHSEWAAPTFVKPKKNKQVRFLTDFRELNKRIKRKPFPIPKIQDLLQELEGFTYATSLDLNMGYYHIELTPNARRLCTIVMPWGKYEYCRLAMGLSVSVDIFQEQMSELMAGLEFVRTYLDDILCITKGDYTDHLVKVEKVLQRLASANLKVNAAKSFFARSELEYLGFWINRRGICPITKKVEAIQRLTAPRTRKELRRFIGMVNYYRDMWPRRSAILAPLARLTSKNVPYRWTDQEQKAFNTMKRIIGRDVLLTYPDFNKKFEIYTDASSKQLGSVIMQNKKPIAFYSRKLNPAQSRYTTTERELLSIVETLKEFRNILFGQEIEVYTDHQNLTYKQFNTERVLRWRLLIEEFGPTITYVKGQHNIVADALSRMNINDLEDFSDDITPGYYAECFGIDELPQDLFPLTYELIDKEQQKDNELLEALRKNQYSVNAFCGGDNTKRDLICHNGKIVIPASLRRRVVEWYHNYLLHPGLNRTEETIQQHLMWKRMRDDIRKYVSQCQVCQKNKKQTKRYGHLPAKEADAIPWERLCVDLIGEYKIARKGKKTLKMKAVTMIDPATGWFEIIRYPDKRAITIANIVEQTWLSRYPWPTLITYDRGSEFIGHEFRDMIVNDYGIKCKPITVRNPQANAIVERVHQVIGNMIRTFELENNYLDDNDPWSGILAATAFAVRSTYHTTLQATPGQLVFGRDMIFNIKHIADWEAIKQRKQSVINKNNARENSKRIEHVYHVNDKVLLERHNARKYECPYLGPYKVTEVFTNGTVTIKKGSVYERVNIRRLYPFHSQT